MSDKPEIKRYQMLDRPAEMMEWEDGECVLYEDHASREQALMAEIAELKNLLQVAECPNNCDGRVYRDHDGEPLPCQFCYERDELINKVRQHER